jgi:GPH family glycoside/pentoside/hexuronide:cation symporter
MPASTGDPPAAEASAARLLAYGLPALPFAILTLPFYILVPPYYTETLGLSIVAVGNVLVFVRLIDAASDPICGVLADRFRPRFGRRRLWLIGAAPLIALAAWQVFVPPPGAGLFHLALWGTLLSLAWTGGQVPYAAWGAELSRSYAGRNRVAAYREAFTVLGTLIALSMPALLPALGWTGSQAVLIAFALMVGIGLPTTVLLAVARVPEPEIRSTVRLSLAKTLRNVADNGPFKRLILAFFVNGLANGLPATLFLFFVNDRLQSPASAGLLLVLYFVAGIAGVPFWLWLARRTSKHRAWAIGMMLACAAFAFAPALGPGDVWPFAAICLFTGLALGADVILPASIQADVIDVHTARTGEERAGLYLSLWALATKLALAGAVGIAFPILGAMGFDPGAGLRTATGLTTLALLYAALPVALKVAAIALIWRFPLDAKAHAELRRTIAARAETV